MTLIRLPYASRTASLVLLAGLSSLAQPALSQARELDSGVLVVSRGSEVIGREEFTLHRGQLSEAGAGFVGAGFTVSATAYYPSSRSYASAASVITFGADSQPAGARMDLEGNGQTTTFVDFTARRITVRHRTSAGESAGQYPRSGRMLLIDDSILCLLTLLPGANSGPVTLFYPRSGQTIRAPLEDLGVELTTVNGDERQLQHVTLGTDDQIRHIWYDSRGHLIKVEIPAQNLIAVRSARR